MANLQSDDLLLINRSDTSYKVTGSDVKNYYYRQPTINSVNLVEKEDLGFDRFNEQSFITTASVEPGRPIAESYSIRGTVNATILDKLETSAITNIGTVPPEWNYRTDPETDGIPYYDITYGAGKFVAASRFANSGKGNVIYSTDGINWTSVPLSPALDCDWNGITYGNGKFVAVGQPNTVSAPNTHIMYSNDGINWTAVPNLGQNPQFQDVVYADGKFVAVASGNSQNTRVFYSYDGINWSYKIAPNEQLTNFWAVTYGGGKFVAVAKSGSYPVMYSNNGISWTSPTFPNVTGCEDITYGNGRYVVAASKGLYYSEDAETWYPLTEANGLTFNTPFLTVDFAANTFVAYKNNSDIYYSHDGVFWYTQSTGMGGGLWRGLAYGDSKFVMCGSNTGSPSTMWSYTASTTQTDLTLTDDKDLSFFKGNDDLRQSDGNAEGVLAAVDVPSKKIRLLNSTGTWATGETVIGPPRPLTTSEITNIGTISGTWNPVNSGYTQVLKAITYGNGKYVALSPEGGNNVLYSTDAITWNTATAPNASWGDLVYADNKFVAVSYSGDPKSMYSTDGINWTASGSGITLNPAAITYGDDKFVTVGNSGRTYYSFDGINWNQTFNSGTNFTDIAYGNGVFVAIGANKSPRGAYSYDGINWTGLSSGESGLSNQVNYQGIAFGNGIFVAVANSGSGSYGAFSSDGINWKLSGQMPYNTWQSIAYGDGAFVALSINQQYNTFQAIYSYDGDLWYESSDGFINNNWEDICFGDGKFVGIAQSPTPSENVIWSQTGGPENRVLTFSNDKNLEAFKFWDSVKQDDDAANGNVVTVNVAARTMEVAQTLGDWSANTNNYIIGPDRSSTLTSTLFCKLNSNLQVIDLVETNPGFTSYTGSSPTIEFPYYLPNGLPVDETLLEGTSIFTTVKVDNLIFNPVTKNSNTITPASTCIAGPIKTAPISSIDTVSGGWNAMTAADGIDQINYLDIAYGNGMFVAVSYSGTDRIAASYDGESWFMLGSANGVSLNQWAGITYGKDKFVVVENLASTRAVLYSFDGINWTQTNGMPYAGRWGAVTYGEDRFVAVDNGYATERCAYSLDGITWESVGQNDGFPNFSWYGVAYGNGRFVACGGARIAYSSDSTATQWTAISSAEQPALGGFLRSIAYGNGKFVAVDQNNTVGAVYSTDGINWSACTGVDLTTKWSGITYGGGMFVAVGELAGSNRAMYSVDGINWTSDSTAPSNNYQAVAFGGDKFVAIANGGTEIAMWNYTGGPDQPQLSFDNPTGLAELKSSDDINQENSAASGKVAVSNPDDLTLRVAGSSGTWAINQKVVGPNRVCPAITFDASDPADVAQFNAIKASFEGYKTSKAQFRANLISQMLSSGISQDEIDALDLDAN